MVGARRRVRSLVLQVLYEVDSTGHDTDEVLSRLLAGETFSEGNINFAGELVHGVIHYKDEIDRSIRMFAPTWPLEQIPLVDRNILRLAIFEILLDNRVSVKIAINEAVELAKMYGSDNSSRFVNGVLGSVSTLVNG